jgi:LysM repeat protein
LLTATPIVIPVAHVVQPGETLFSISQLYGVSLEALRAANGLTSDLIFAGQTLVIPPPGGGDFATPPPTLAPATVGPDASASPTHTQAPSNPQAPSVIAFTVDKVEARPGEALAVSWTTANTTQAWLYAHPANDISPGQVVAPTGSLTVTVGADANCLYLLRLVIHNPSSSGEHWLTVRLPPAHSFALAPAPAGIACAAEPSRQSAATLQAFEHGQLLYLEAGPSLDARATAGGPATYALFPDGTAYVVGYTWTPADPDSDPAFVPPAGLLQPTGRLGKAWRTTWIRERLGWATAPAQDFSAAVQASLEVSSDLLGYYVLGRGDVELPEGQVLRLFTPRSHHQPLTWASVAP